ncbi:MAG: RNA polymerase sigma factor [Gemmatimonadota bacterium]|nr:MAG: RNA polymerase sigma factor [Gemmatimonadota bacterium]
MKDGEQRLIEQLKAGETEAFRELVERYKKQAYYVAYDLMGTHEDAEDISQEAFIKVYQSIGSFRGEAQFSTWLYRIVVNLCISEKRKKSSKEMEYYGDTIPEAAHHAQDIDPSEHPEKALQSQKIQEHIREALDKLPSQQKTVFVLRFYQDLSLKEIGRIMKLSEGTVKSHLFRTLRKLREYLKFYEADFGLE